MEDYKVRMVYEYQQTKDRYEKLKAMTTKCEAADVTNRKPEEYLGFDPKCPIYLLREQQEFMGRYLHCLEVRAVIEQIDLNSLSAAE